MSGNFGVQITCAVGIILILAGTVGSILFYAIKNPYGAMMEGNELLVLKQFEMQEKGLPPIILSANVAAPKAEMLTIEPSP